MASLEGLDQSFISPGYNLFVSLFSGIYQICIPTFPFDLATQSGTYLVIYSKNSIGGLGFKISGGQQVLLDDPSKGKLNPRWIGPWVVEELKEPSTVKIRMGTSTHVVHTNRNRPTP